MTAAVATACVVHQVLPPPPDGCGYWCGSDQLGPVPELLALAVVELRAIRTNLDELRAAEAAVRPKVLALIDTAGPKLALLSRLFGNR